MPLQTARGGTISKASPARPRIGVYAAFLEPARSGGAETYTRGLLAALQQLDVDEEFLVFAPTPHDIELTNDRFHIVPCPIDAARRKRRILWEQCVLPGILKRARLDLVHFPYGTMPCFYKGRSVVTIHDTLRFSFPEQIPSARRWYHRFVQSRIAAGPHQIICVSGADAESLVPNLPVPAGRVSVVHHGVSDELLESPGESVSGGRDLLWLGRPYPSKNLPVLLQAYAILAQRCSNLPRLRLVGVTPQEQPRLRRLVSNDRAASRISFEPPLPHAQLPRLLREALCLVYPSRQESFGLPVLEAMAAGVPVVAADIPTFRELHGDAVLFAQPDSPPDLATQMERLVTSAKLRDRYSRKGRQRAAQFTWQRCAERTYGLYRRLLGR